MVMLYRTYKTEINADGGAIVDDSVEPLTPPVEVMYGCTYNPETELVAITFIDGKGGVAHDVQMPMYVAYRMANHIAEAAAACITVGIRSDGEPLQ